MGNNWMNGKDKNGKLFGADDLFAFGIGFLTGFLEYAFSDNFVHIGKALESGVLDGLISEAGYLTLGGGLSQLGRSDVVFDNNYLITSQSYSALAIPYASSYAATSAFSYAQNYSQITAASSADKIGLLAGYSATSAISAGFNSNNMQGWVDKAIGGANKFFAGAVSQGIGGAISNAGNNILQNGGGWQSSTGFSALTGFVSSFAGQLAHNYVGNLFPEGTIGSEKKYIYYSSVDIFKNLSSNVASGVVQQLFGNWGSQYGYKNGYLDVGNPNWYDYIFGSPAGWGSYLNGLGGFQSDMFNDAF
jgi:hypothetical protein